jgi:hypothetical protein
MNRAERRRDARLARRGPVVQAVAPRPHNPVVRQTWECQGDAHDAPHPVEERAYRIRSEVLEAIRATATGDAQRAAVHELLHSGWLARLFFGLGGLIDEWELIESVEHWEWVDGERVPCVCGCEASGEDGEA